MSVKVQVELDYTVGELVQKAILHGFLRIEPRKRWTVPEQKEAIRWYLAYLVRKDVAQNSLPPT